MLEIETKPDFAGFLKNYRGVKEYTGIVAEIQKWYYGSLIKASWCATCLSYVANRCGALNKIGGKNENVYNMMCACRDKGDGTFFTRKNLPEKIEKNDILFWLWSGDIMTTTSSKHVGVAEYASYGNEIFCIGGNQKDKICTLKYDKKYLYAVFRVN